MNSRSVLAVACGALAYLALYAMFVVVLNLGGRAALSAPVYSGIALAWILFTPLSGVLVARIRGMRSFFHGCAAGALGALLMLAVLRWILGPIDHTGVIAVFWVMASAGLGGCGPLIGRDPPRDPTTDSVAP